MVPRGPVPLHGQVGNLLDGDSVVDDFEGVLAVELDEGQGALAWFLALLDYESVEAADHIALQAVHGSRAVDEKRDVDGRRTRLHGSADSRRGWRVRRCPMTGRLRLATAVHDDSHASVS